MDLITLVLAKKYAREVVEGVTEVLDGTGAEYYSLAPTALSFRSSASLDEFQDVLVDGEVVDSLNYNLEEGSTIVTLSADYLKTLGPGNHEVTVVSQSKSIRGEFTVKVPDLNEYGFYYNQPYTVYVEALGGNTTFFLRDNGTMDCLVNGQVTETATYSSTNKAIVVSSMMGTFNGIISDNGAEIYCQELLSTFALGDETIVADDEYIYLYNEDLGGYEVQVIDKTKAEYGAIKTGINGIDTVKISDFACNVNEYIESIIIPRSVVSIGVSAFIQCASLASITFVEGSQLSIIGNGAFKDCSSLVSITIPSSVERIDGVAFAGCILLTHIAFNGTIAQWNAIEKGHYWNDGIPATHVQCSDGTVAL